MRRLVRPATKPNLSPDQRAVYRFLFLPKTLPTHDGRHEWRWLEMAKIQQKVRSHLRFTTGLAPERVYRWHDTHWLN
jgi:hypothetical protein